MKTVATYLIGAAFAAGIFSSCSEDKAQDQYANVIGKYPGTFSGMDKDGIGGTVNGMITIMGNDDDINVNGQTTVDIMITIDGESDILEDVVINGNGDGNAGESLAFGLWLDLSASSNNDNEGDDDGLLDGGLFASLGLNFNFSSSDNDENGDGEGDLDIAILDGDIIGDDLNIALTTSTDLMIRFDGEQE